MASLAELQHHMQSLILGAGAATNTAVSADEKCSLRNEFLSHLRPAALAETDELLDIYCSAYRSRLAEVLEADLKCLSSYLGKDLFGHVAAGYIDAHPSRVRNVRWFSKDMPAFLAATSPFSKWPQVSELARIELALADAFDATDATPIDLATLTAISPDDWAKLIVIPHPSVRRIDALTNAYGIWRAIHSGAEAPPPERLQEPQWLVVWREGSVPRIRAMPDDEAAAFDTAHNGATFVNVVTSMTTRHEDHETAAHKAVGFLAGWAAAGMLAAEE